MLVRQNYYLGIISQINLSLFIISINPLIFCKEMW